MKNHVYVIVFNIISMKKGEYLCPPLKHLQYNLRSKIIGKNLITNDCYDINVILILLAKTRAIL